MKIKSTINFKDLRDKGANSLEILDDEVVQLKTKKNLLCIVRQEFLLQLMKDARQSPFQLSKLEDQPNIFLSNKLTGSVNNLNPDLKRDHIFGARNDHLNIGNISSLLSKVNLDKTMEERVKTLEDEVKRLKEQGGSDDAKNNRNGNKKS